MARRPSGRPISKPLRIVRSFPADLQSHFVNHMVLQHQEEYFILSFFEVWPPAILEASDEEAARVLERMETVEAKCVARLVLTPTKMREVLAAIQSNIKKFDEKVEEGLFTAEEE